MAYSSDFSKKIVSIMVFLLNTYFLKWHLIGMGCPKNANETIIASFDSRASWNAYLNYCLSSSESSKYSNFAGSSE
jgi:hypothetical protein